MDDIYDNLDNYCYDEVQNENKVLKTKLEEITCQLTDVQSDYDHLKEEFRKLETHYSSLLKTAKAEIQRKTQIISTLNAEKDKLIIKQVLNENRNKQSFHNRQSYEKGSINNEQVKRNNNSYNEVKKREESRADPRLKEPGDVHEIKTETRLSELNRNTTEHSTPPENPSKITNNIRERRKSIDTRKFFNNSDEENVKQRSANNDKLKSDETRLNTERNTHTNVENHQDQPMRPTRERRQSLYHTKPRKSPSHLSSDEEDNRTKNKIDKNYRSSSKDEYNPHRRDMRNRLCEKPQQRNIERYEDDRNYRNKPFKKLAPIRERRKSAYDSRVRHMTSSSEGEHNEVELKSRERYKNRFISDHNRKQSHSPSHIDTRNSDRLSRDSNRFDNKYIEHHGSINRGRPAENINKKRSPIPDYSKRNRSRCYGDFRDNETERSKERKRDISSPTSYKTKDYSPNEQFYNKRKDGNEPRPNKHKLDCDEHVDIKRMRTDENQHLENQNCNKSFNDHVDCDTVQNNQQKTQSVKDIRKIEAPNTDMEPKDSKETDFELKPRIDDPRLSSNKYVKVFDAKDNVYITTRVGNNVDLIYIKYDDNPQVTFPTPSNCLDIDESHIKDIYMDIDKQVNYLSPESGELLDSEGTNDVYFSEQSNQCNEMLSNSRKNNLSKTLATQLNDPLHVGFSKDSNAACEMTVFGNYKIPKICDENKRVLCNKVLESDNKYGKNLDQDKNLTHDNCPNNIPNCKISATDKNTFKEDTKTDFIKKMNALKDAESPKYTQFVAQDLELSDENNDSQELSYVSDATLNTTNKGTSLCNTTEVKPPQKVSTKSKSTSLKYSDLFGDSLISPEDLDLPVHMNSTPLGAIDAPVWSENKEAQQEILHDPSESLKFRNKTKEKSSKRKEKSKHKKKSSKKDKDKAKAKDNKNDSLTDSKNTSKDINRDITEPIQVTSPAIVTDCAVYCNTDMESPRLRLNDVESSRTRLEDVESSRNRLEDMETSTTRLENMETSTIKLEDVNSSIMSMYEVAPTHRSTSAGGCAYSPRTDVSQPDIRIVLKRRRTVKKKN